jgi:signal transduction histidine kinase
LKASGVPEPLRIGPDNLLQDEYDAKLVGIEGVLYGFTRSQDSVLLEMRSGTKNFTATLAGDHPQLAKSLRTGSRVELTGVYVGEGGNRVLGRPIESFHLLLNSPADVAVIARPPWWTLPRLFAAVGVLLAGLILALVWVQLLQSRVAERTRQLEASIGERQRAEQLRALEHERARLAQDLHDDLGAGLTEVNILGSLARNATTPPDEKDRFLEQLSGVARNLVTSLDEIVWAVNPRNDSVASTAGYFAAYAQQFLDLAQVSCGLKIDPNLPQHPLNSKIRHEIFLAFKEALNNIVRHARASQAQLEIRVENEILNLCISDNGQGFDLSNARSGGNGLANMRDRVKSMAGSTEIESAPGRGTTVRFHVPLSREHA